MIAVESVRQEWQQGYRRFEGSVRDPVLRPQLLEQLELITDELRKRVGQTFTIAELVSVYARADDWARAAVEERAERPGWARTVALAQDAAFHQYQRGAVDYVP